MIEVAVDSKVPYEVSLIAVTSNAYSVPDCNPLTINIRELLFCVVTSALPDFTTKLYNVAPTDESPVTSKLKSLEEATMFCGADGTVENKLYAKS